MRTQLNNVRLMPLALILVAVLAGIGLGMDNSAASELPTGEACFHETVYDYDPSAALDAQSAEQAVGSLVEQAAAEVRTTIDGAETNEAYPGYYEAIAAARASNLGALAVMDDAAVWVAEVQGQVLAVAELSQQPSGWRVDRDSVRLPMEVCLLLEA